MTGRLGTRVERIDRDHDAWIVRIRNGELRARQVVVATGYEHQPAIADWPARSRFGGDLLHSSGYRNSAPFRAVGGRPAVGGLRFIGYVPRPGGLGYMGTEAVRAAKAIARELQADGRRWSSR
jgi:hypothetical protein